MHNLSRAALFLEHNVLHIIASEVYMFFQIGFNSSVQSFFFFHVNIGKVKGKGGGDTLLLALGCKRMTVMKMLTYY